MFLGPPRQRPGRRASLGHALHFMKEVAVLDRHRQVGSGARTPVALLFLVARHGGKDHHADACLSELGTAFRGAIHWGGDEDIAVGGHPVAGGFGDEERVRLLPELCQQAPPQCSVVCGDVDGLLRHKGSVRVVK